MAMSTERPVIAVFGSSQPEPGSQVYEQALAVGRGLADAGFAIATGGYAGTMEAASRGASEAGGHVIGVGAARIEEFRPGGLNQYVDEAIFFETLQERVLHLVRENVGMVVCPGGIGTLSELALAWSFLQVGEIETRPLVLFGEFWQRTMSLLLESQWVAEPDRALLLFADTPAEVVRLIRNHTGSHS